MQRNRSHAKARKLADDSKAHGRPFDEMGDRLPGAEAGGEEIDGVISMLGEIDVESVESLAEAGLGKEVAEKEGEWTEEEREERPPVAAAAASSASFAEDTSDPVRMYLQEIGAVSLLSREQEVEIAKQIEEGEKQVRENVLNHPFLINYLLEIADRIKAGELSERELKDEEAPTPLRRESGGRCRRGQRQRRRHPEDPREAAEGVGRAHPGARGVSEAQEADARRDAQTGHGRAEGAPSPRRVAARQATHHDGGREAEEGRARARPPAGRHRRRRAQDQAERGADPAPRAAASRATTAVPRRPRRGSCASASRKRDGRSTTSRRRASRSATSKPRSA